jgi:anti-anti-sigma factor
MLYSITEEGGVVIATFGESSPNARMVRRVLHGLLQQVAHAGGVVLDLGAVHHLDAAGAGALLNWLAEARTRTPAMALCARHPSLLALLELVRAHRLVEIFDEPAKAVLHVGHLLGTAVPKTAFPALAS